MEGTLRLQSAQPIFVLPGWKRILFLDIVFLPLGVVGLFSTGAQH